MTQFTNFDSQKSTGGFIGKASPISNGKIRLSGKYGYLLHGKRLEIAFQTDGKGNAPLSDYLNRIALLRYHAVQSIGIYATPIRCPAARTFQAVVCIGLVCYRSLWGKFGSRFLGVGGVVMLPDA